MKSGHIKTSATVTKTDPELVQVSIEAFSNKDFLILGVDEIPEYIADALNAGAQQAVVPVVVDLNVKSITDTIIKWC